jgi:hypothetical protein
VDARLKALEIENARLKKLRADSMLENEVIDKFIAGRACPEQYERRGFLQELTR